MKNIMMAVVIPYLVRQIIAIRLETKERLLPFMGTSWTRHKLPVLTPYLIQTLKQWHILRVSLTFYPNNGSFNIKY